MARHDFFIKTFSIRGVEHYKVGWTRQETDARGKRRERFVGVSCDLRDRGEAERFLAMMLRNERVCEERTRRILNGDFLHNRGKRRKGGEA